MSRDGKRDEEVEREKQKKEKSATTDKKEEPGSGNRGLLSVTNLRKIKKGKGKKGR